MSSILRDLHNSIWFRFNEISIKYDDCKPIPPVIHKQFHTLIDQYMDLALKSHRDTCDRSKKRYEESLTLYRTAQETFADCPASSSDKVRSTLYTRAERLEQTCARRETKWIKSRHRYEDEYERIEETLPKCPHCEEIKEERIEQMRESLYREMEEERYATTGCTGRSSHCDCSDCEDYWENHG
jgi:hypothetical protein